VQSSAIDKKEQQERTLTFSYFRHGTTIRHMTS